MRDPFVTGYIDFEGEFEILDGRAQRQEDPSIDICNPAGGNTTDDKPYPRVPTFSGPLDFSRNHATKCAAHVCSRVCLRADNCTTLLRLVFGLWLLNHLQTEIQPLDTLTMIGFVILIGTVVNNAILIVHQALNNMREAGMPPDLAVLDSVRTRLRPIFMTLFTTVFGLAPLVFFPGAGSELYRGIGSILIGGLVVSTFFTLFLVPTLFRLALSVKAGLAGAFGMQE